MLDPSSFLQAIHVEESCLDLPYTKEILTRCSDIPITIVKDRQTPDIGIHPYPKNLLVGKQHLYLCQNRGKFLKPCPATKEYCCCDYNVINIGMNCPMDCVYCILQAYLNNPWLSFFVNIEDLFNELDAISNDSPFLRIGTGEFTDSMALDRITGLSSYLITYFSNKDNMILELKSKAAPLDHLCNLQPNNRTIMAWSLNSPPIMEREELRTATLTERLQAAAQCADMGYLLAFHFDPIIYHENWQEGYTYTIEQLFQYVPPERIVWISMGCLRFLPPLRNIATQRFPGSSIFYEEFVPGLDGKQRYFRQLRVSMYQHLHDLLQKKLDAATCLYLCMESDEIWQQVFGYTPGQYGGLPAMLSKTARHFMNIAG